jgi:hypothetical protein
MDNQELKIAFDEVNKKINEAKAAGNDTKELMQEKARLLKIGYDKISELTKGEEYARNPRKYSKELSFLNNIKKVLNEINEPTREIEKLINDTYLKMRENGLGWILDNLDK